MYAPPAAVYASHAGTTTGVVDADGVAGGVPELDGVAGGVPELERVCEGEPVPDALGVPVELVDGVPV